MNTTYLPAFIKDLRRLRQHPEYSRIRRLAFEEMPGWKSLAGRSQIKCLSAHEKAYRIRAAITASGFTGPEMNWSWLGCCTGGRFTAFFREES